jgi:hypothetical protein
MTQPDQEPDNRLAAAEVIGLLIFAAMVGLAWYFDLV